MKGFLGSRRNRLDLFHVTVPLVMVLSMSPTSFAGALLFLVVWGLIRTFGYG
ncbi:hypothetical protein [Ruegeria sp. EL01]|uniref:hypothetical protein n=1 Tax=Ruegeria sp. EL01 TaxID=2107578 RepID=UPI0013C48A7D|nr:hypothetical protein [Ruegeria sp. EL01]